MFTGCVNREYNIKNGSQLWKEEIGEKIMNSYSRTGQRELGKNVGKTISCKTGNITVRENNKRGMSDKAETSTRRR